MKSSQVCLEAGMYAVFAEPRENCLCSLFSVFTFKQFIFPLIYFLQYLFKLYLYMQVVFIHLSYILQFTFQVI